MPSRGFQLLEARPRDALPGPMSPLDSSLESPPVRLQELRSSGGQKSDHITAVIGKNGTGKSHLLSTIVQTFLALERVKTHPSHKPVTLPVDYMSYYIDGKMCEIYPRSQRGLKIMIDRRDRSIAELPLPERVVALTISPFDKFPVPRSIRSSVVPADPSLYRYLGLRDQFGKASLDTLLFKSLSNLFDNNEDGLLRNSNIGAVFDYLDLQPTISVIYQFRAKSTVLRALDKPQSLFDSDLLDEYQRRRLEAVMKTGMTEGELLELLALAVQSSENSEIRLSADFSTHGTTDNTFRRLTPLRRAGFLKLKRVEISETQGRLLDLKNASSGQQSVVSSLLALASVIKDRSLILIDEPEISLHPEWQVDYVDLLLKTFGRFQGCHFVIATHSPLVISKMPSYANVIAFDRPDLPPVKKLVGQSSDYLLVEAFGAPTPGNLYIREKIVGALGLVAEGKANSERFNEEMNTLRKIGEELEATDPAREVIADLERVAKDAGTETKP